MTRFKVINNKLILICNLKKEKDKILSNNITKLIIIINNSNIINKKIKVFRIIK
jgi:hypothetical protein